MTTLESYFKEITNFRMVINHPWLDSSLLRRNISNELLDNNTDVVCLIKSIITLKTLCWKTPIFQSKQPMDK